MRKYIILVLVTFFLTSSPVFAQEQEGIEPSSWAKDGVSKMIQNGIVPERLQQAYQSPITREEFAQLALNTVLNISGIERQKVVNVITRQESFKDTYLDYVDGAYNLGIINGVTENKFEPTKYLNREQAAVIISNMIISLGQEVNESSANFNDQGGISSWAVKGVNISYHAGIFKGTLKGFEPREYYTREQAIITLGKLIKLIPSSDCISIRGKVMMKGEDIDQIAVGQRFVEIGSLKNSRDYTNIIGKIKENVSQELYQQLIDEKNSHSYKEGIYTYETYTENALLRISW